MKPPQLMKDSWLGRNMKGDPILWFVSFLLLMSSVIVVYSASVKDAYSIMQGNTEYFLFKHSLMCIGGFGAMLAVHRIPYYKFARISRIAVWFCIVLLIFTLVSGKSVNDASRWLEIPIINQRFQPSEIAKIALITHLSLILARHIKSDWKDKKMLREPMILVGTVCALISDSNISTCLLLGAVCMLLMFVGKVPIKYLFVAGCAAILVLFILIQFKGSGRSGTAVSRVSTYFDKDTVDYQSMQSYMAMARGGLTGVGTSKSVHRRFLPEPQKDFIYAVLVEEYGTFSGLGLLILYMVILVRGLQAIDKTKRPFGGLLSAGLTFSIVIQALCAMAVTVGLFPVTGQTLPFFSQGGTSIILTGIALGMIISVSRGDLEEKNI
jgi:cell division protein FtsW